MQAVLDRKLRPQTLEKLARILYSPTFEGLKELNSDIGSCDAGDVPERLARRLSHMILHSLALKALVLLGIAFGIEFFVLFLYTGASAQRLAAFSSTNPAVIIPSGFIAWAALLAGFLRK